MSDTGTRTWFAHATISSALHSDPDALNNLAVSLAPEGSTDVTVSSIHVEEVESALHPDMVFIYVKGKAIPAPRTTPDRSSAL